LVITRAVYMRMWCWIA